MLAKTVSHYVETASADWKPSKVAGVHYAPLRADKNERSGTFLLRMAPNTSYPRHRHPAGEEILVLKGEMTVGGRKMKSGDFLFSPPGSIHEASTVEGCMFLSIVPKPIEIIGSASADEFADESAQPA